MIIRLIIITSFFLFLISEASFALLQGESVWGRLGKGSKKKTQ